MWSEHLGVCERFLRDFLVEPWESGRELDENCGIGQTDKHIIRYILGRDEDNQWKKGKDDQEEKQHQQNRFSRCGAVGVGGMAVKGA